MKTQVRETRSEGRYLLYRLLVMGLVLAVIILFESVERGWLGRMSVSIQSALPTVLVLFFGAAIVLAVDRYLHLDLEKKRLTERNQEVEKQVGDAYQRLATVFRVSQSFAEASDEKEVVELVLRLSVEFIRAKGASFVPLDERGRTLPAMTAGDMPFPGGEAWLEYLASPATRQQCSSCKNHEHLTLTCPLLRGSFMDTMGIYCLPLRRGDQEYGILNLYIPQPGRLDAETQAFLRTVVDETTLALEGIRLRKRELATLRQLQDVREKTDLKNMLSGLLEDLHETLEADFATATVWDGDPKLPRSTLTYGDLPPSTQPLIEGIIQSVFASRQPVMLGNVAGEGSTSPGVRSLLAAPLIAQDRKSLGVLLVANRRARSFNQRQLSMLQTVAGQVALVIQNVNLMAELEFKTVLQERTRLAREIHDGLAQTLGFLKLKLAQMRNYADHGDYDLLRTTIPICYDALSDAYQDTREVIDGLRLSPSGSGLDGWLKQAVAEFQEYSGLQVTLCDAPPAIELPPEVHAQLVRIVQESLSNIRKHARARQVWFSCRQLQGDLIIEIRDDGTGFDSEDVPGSSKHGLRGMRERAELIGADFQVISHPMEGTTIRVQLPLIGEEAL